MLWAKYDHEDCIAVAICNYTSPPNPHHMKLRVGDVIRVTEYNQGWYRGYKFVSPCSRKVFPGNFVVLFSQDRITQLGAEIYSWIPNLQLAYLNMDKNTYFQLTESIEKIFPDKKSSYNEKLQASEMSKKSQEISEIKRMLSLPIEYKNEKDLIRESIMFNKASFLDMYNFHYKEWRINRNPANQRDVQLDRMSIYIKFLELNFERSQLIDDNYEINTILYTQSEDKSRLVRISETNRLVVNAQFTGDLMKTQAIVTKDLQLFPKQKVYIGLQFIRTGPMKSKNETGSNNYRRPKGVSLIEFLPGANQKSLLDENKKVGIQLVTQKEEFLEHLLEKLMPETRNLNCKMYTNYVTLQIKIIKSSSTSDRDSLLFGLDPHYPSMPIGSPLTSSLYSSSSSNNSLSYCNSRNMLYVTLHHCDLDRGTKKSDPNFEVEITFVDETGTKVRAVNDFIEFHGHKSVVYYHQSRCYWIEMVSVPLQDKYDKRPHLRFVISHKSLRGPSKNQLGVAYLQLFPGADSSAFVSDCKNDNYHTLNVIRMDSVHIEKCKYLDYPSQPTMATMEPVQTLPHKSKWKSNKKVAKESPEYLYVQTQLCSYEYTSDGLIANLCCGAEVNMVTINMLSSIPSIDARRIDPMELKKLSVKILDRCLLLLQKAQPNNHLGRNLMAILAEMFLIIKNYPDHQLQLNHFIQQTKHFQIHIPILTELKNHYSDEMFIRAADWFIKIAVKSFENYQNEVTHNQTSDEHFAKLVNDYLHNLEMLSKDKALPKLRAHVGKQTGPIMNALTQLCGDPQFHLAQFVDHLLENFSDMEARCTSDLTMEVIHSKLFVDPEFRRRIVPRTTMNIVAMCKAQMRDVQGGRESRQGIPLDSVCEKLINFMVAHEKNWTRPCVSDQGRQEMVKELLIDTRLFRQMIEIVGHMFEYVEREDNCHSFMYDVGQSGTQAFSTRITSYMSNSSGMSMDTGITFGGAKSFGKQHGSMLSQLQAPLMVLVSTVMCCLGHLCETSTLLSQMLSSDSNNCILCGKLCVTNLFDFVQEIVGFISMLQKHTVFPHDLLSASSSTPATGTSAPSVTSSNMIQKQPWIEMLFLQTKILLTTLTTLDSVFLKTVVVKNLQQYQDLQIYSKNWPSSDTVICNCHPTITEQTILVRQFADAMCDIILQPFLCIEAISGISALRVIENFGDIREEGAIMIKKMWDCLGILKQQFSSTFMPIFGKMTTIQNYNIRLIATQAILDMIHLNRKVHTMGLITEIDQAMESSHDESYCTEMTKALKEAVQLSLQQPKRPPLPNQNGAPPVAAKAHATADEDSRLVDQIIRQMTNIQECSRHLQDESTISGMIVINNLQMFYKSMGRSDIINRYLMKLMDRLASIKNFTEMGFTLRELSSFYQWSEEEVDPIYFPREYRNCTTSWMMKAALLEKSLEYFDFEDWETGIEICKQLEEGYSTYAVDFLKLSEIYKRMSDYNRRIIRENRPRTNFFAIFYLGEGFPKFVSELPCRSVLFRTRCPGPEVEGELKKQFPGVPLKRGFPPDDFLTSMGPEQLIQYVPVSPYKPDIPSVYLDKPVKQRIIQYYKNYQLSRFSFCDQLNRIEDNIDKKQYIIRSINIEGKLPHILSVAPITKICAEDSKPYIVSVNELVQRLDIDEMLYDDFQLATPDEKKFMYQKVSQSVLSYISPVSGGVNKIMTMIRDDPDGNLSHYQNVFSRLLHLINNMLQQYDAYDILTNYETMTEEFQTLIDLATEIFDYGFDDEFSICYLIETFKKVKEPKTFNVVANRRPSVISRSDESANMTLGRRRVPVLDPVLDEKQELGSERHSTTSDESVGSGVFTRNGGRKISLTTPQYRPPSQTESVSSSGHMHPHSNQAPLIIPPPLSHNNSLSSNTVSGESSDVVTTPTPNSSFDMPQIPPRPNRNQNSTVGASGKSVKELRPLPTDEDV